MPAKDLLTTNKEQTSIIRNEEIVDFAFNPDTRKRNETFTGKHGPTSPQNLQNLSNSVEGDLNAAITEAERKKAMQKAKPLPNVVMEEDVRQSVIVDP